LLKKSFPQSPSFLGRTLFRPAAVVALGAIAVIAQAAQAGADQKTPSDLDGYSLYQTSAVLGDKDVLLTPNAVKIVDRKNGTGLIAHAPDWKVYLVNPRSKRICSYTLIKYPGISQEICGITGGLAINKLPLKRGEKTTAGGVAAVSCETTKAFESKQMKDRERAFAGPRFVKSGQLLIADQGPLDKLPRQTKSILCRFYGVPEFAGQGLPLQFKYVDFTDEQHTLLLTNNLTVTKFPADTFDPPKDFAVVSDMSKLDNRQKVKDNGPVKATETVKKWHKQ
jgi:hypothetical protein